METPSTSEYHEYFQPYIDHLIGNDKGIIANMEDASSALVSMMKTVPSDKEDYAYAEGKWTIKQLIQHIIDTERIFCYRALRIARNDATNLLGFDHDAYVDNCDVSHRSLADLVHEFEIVRQGTILLFKSFTADALKAMGTANDVGVSVRAIGFIVSGHQVHHMKVIKERYL
jgi:hypothetical protein